MTDELRAVTVQHGRDGRPGGARPVWANSRCTGSFGACPAFFGDAAAPSGELRGVRGSGADGSAPLAAKPARAHVGVGESRFKSVGMENTYLQWENTDLAQSTLGVWKMSRGCYADRLLLLTMTLAGGGLVIFLRT